MAGWTTRLYGGLERARQRRWLEQASSVGRGVVFLGRPFIDNRGVLTIGDEVCVSSRPVQSHFVIGAHGNMSIGRRVAISYGAAFASELEISIGDDTRIGPLVVVMDTDFHVIGDRFGYAEPKPIVIGKNVVIESRVTILRGSTIGDGARVRSGSVVSGQIDAGDVVAGVPASSWSEHAQVAEGADLEITNVVMRALNLPFAPELGDGPEQIPQWDSFGALKLLLALERTYQVSIREQHLRSARSIADLAEVVAAARSAA